MEQGLKPSKFVKVTDVYGDVHYVNPDVVQHISSWKPFGGEEDEMNKAICVITYGGGHIDNDIYMSIPAEEVAVMFGYWEKT